MSALEWLDAVRADLDEATPGPWRSEWDDADRWHSITGAGHDLRGGLWMVCPEVATVEAGGDADARLIASAPDRLDRMERALRGVTAMHRPRPNTVSALSPYPLCECGLEWGDDGCPTVTTIKEELGDE